MKKRKSKIILCVIILAVLAFAFWYGGDAPGLRGWMADNGTVLEPAQSIEPKAKEEKIITDKLSDNPTPSEVLEEKTDKNQQPKPEEARTTEEKKMQKIPDNAPASANSIAEESNLSGGSDEYIDYSEEIEMTIEETTGKDKYQTASVPAGKPVPIEPQDTVISDKELTCTLSVRCDTVLKNIAWFDKEKLDIIPQDGIIYSERIVSFYEGESVFNLLLREMKRNKIHMEFENTPIYNSAYIEGIANLYEFDCGELSGWMYKVNGWFPNYGCSRYQLKAGDKVEWVYTCDLGADVGGHYAANRN